MAQGISPNNLNKISEVYLSQISEHHKKDADGNTIPHEGEEVEEGAGLYANIHAKRKRGGKMRKKGDKGAPSSQDFANAARTAKEETEIGEAKVDTGRSDYGKASIRNYRRMGPGHSDPGMFDPEGKRGKTIDKRREEHKARRGVKGAKVPAYKVEEVEVDEAMKPSNMAKKAKLSAALKRLEDMKVASKMKEEVQDTEEGIQYGIFKGDGKPKGAMAAFGKKKKKEKKVKMEGLSNWKEDYVWEADEEKMEKEVKEKKVKNKIIINPKLGEAVEELGGQLIDVQEMNGDKKEDDPFSTSGDQLLLPRIEITTEATIVDEPKIPAEMKIISDQYPIESQQLGIEFRGSSSQMFPKKSYGFETWTNDNQDMDISIGGYPEEEDWILYAPYTDKSLVRNVIIYELSNNIG